MVLLEFLGYKALSVFPPLRTQLTAHTSSCGVSMAVQDDFALDDRYKDTRPCGV